MAFLDSIFGFLSNPAVSVGLQALSGYSQYQQQKKADKASAIAANTEASILESDARRAGQEELAMAEKARRQQVMSFLKSGVDLTGSPLLVMEETRQKGIENAKNVIDSANRKAGLIRQQGSVRRASLVNTALDTVGGIQNTLLNQKQLKKVTE